MGVTQIINSYKSLEFHIENMRRDFPVKKHIEVSISYTPKKFNSQSMRNTWRMWMRETAAFMAGNGVTMPLAIKEDGTFFGKRPFNENDSHELWVRTWTGLDADGERYKTASGDKGVMLEMMSKHQAWANDRGVSLTIPRDSEFKKLFDGQSQ